MAVARHYGEGEVFMPEKQTMKRAQRAKREGKSPSTQAGEFVREEIHHIREGKHGARSTKQAIAIGLSKARRAGVRLAPPKKGKVSESTWRNAERDYQASRRKKSHSSERRSKALNGRSSAKVLVLRRAKLCKNRRAPPRDVGREPPAQRLPDGPHARRAAVDARSPLVKRRAPARDGSRGEV